MHDFSDSDDIQYKASLETDDKNGVYPKENFISDINFKISGCTGKSIRIEIQPDQLHGFDI